MTSQTDGFLKDGVLMAPAWYVSFKAWIGNIDASDVLVMLTICYTLAGLIHRIYLIREARRKKREEKDVQSTNTNPG